MDTIDIIGQDNKNKELSALYESDGFLNLIKTRFTDEQQQLFATSCRMYLRRDKKEFSIDLDDVYKWIGFTQKDSAKKFLKANKRFNINEDYKVIVPENKPKSHGGHNKEQILITQNCFKKLCSEKRSKNAYDYLSDLESLFVEYTVNYFQEKINDYEKQLKHHKEQLLLQSSEQVEELRKRNEELTNENRQVKKDLKDAYRFNKEDQEKREVASAKARLDIKRRAYLDLKERIEYPRNPSNDYPGLFETFVDRTYALSRHDHMSNPDKIYYTQEMLYDFELWLRRQGIMYPEDAIVRRIIRRHFAQYSMGDKLELPNFHPLERYGGITPA